MLNAFVDTNVFLYCFDTRDHRKHQAATKLVSGLGDKLFLSTQVLQEFYWNATRRLDLTPAQGLEVVEQLCTRSIVQVTPTLIVTAVETSERYRISFWDSLIVEAAKMGHCRVVYSEDLNHGQSIRGVRIENPFL